MGLKSLPILNKSGVSMYWFNIWDSIRLYKKYKLSYSFLNEVIFFFFTENIYYYLLFNSHSFKLKKKLNDYDLNIKSGKYFLKKLFIGKIVFFQYQTWNLVLVSYFSVNVKNIDYKKIGKPLNNLILNFLFFNHNKSNIFYYKYKF